MRIVSQEHKTATDRRAETRVNTAWPRHEPIDGRSDSFRNTPAHAVYVSSSQHGARRYAPTFQTQTPTPARIGADRTHPRGLFDSGRPPAIYRPLHARLPYTPPIVYSSWFFGWRGDACSFCASSYAPFGLYSFWGCGWSGWATPYRTPVWSSPVGSWRRCYPVTVAYVWDPWPVYRSYYFYEYEPAPVAQAEAVYAAPVTAAVAQPIPATTPSADAPTDAGIPAAVTPSADATGSADREAEYGLALPAYQIPEELFVLDFVSYAETLDSGAIWASYAAMDRQDGEEEPYLELETAAQNP